MANQNPSETERLIQLTTLTDRLSEIIAAETGALKDRRPREITEFEEEKTRLAKVFASEVTRLKKDPRLTRGVPREVTTALRQATTRFRELTERQEVMLNAMKSVSERMVRDIATELKRMQAPELAYGRNAAYSAQRAAPFALNRTA